MQGPGWRGDMLSKNIKFLCKNQYMTNICPERLYRLTRTWIDNHEAPMSSLYTPCTDILLKNRLRAIHAFVFIGGLRPMMKMSLWELILIHNLTNLNYYFLHVWSESVCHHGWWQQWRQMDCTWLHKWNLPCNCALYIGLCELVPLHIQRCESLPESG